jgi:Gluconate 2-dehydrogenase subunit 3
MTDKTSGAHRADPQDMLSRRQMLEVTAAALATPLLEVGPATAPPAALLPSAPKFLTAPEFALLEELSELIIPTDAHSPGARAAGVAAEIDFRLSETLEPEQQASWRAGLAAVDALSQELNGKAFLQAAAAQRVAVLTQMAAGEKAPKTPVERFFQELKGWTVRAYYSSKIGIHADQQYKGNVYQRGDYAGYDAT